GLWRTHEDPWDLIIRALEERRRREIGPALDMLRNCARMAAVEGDCDQKIRVKIGKLLSIADDLAAIGMQTGQLSPRALGRLGGFGGQAARLIGRARRDGRGER